mgnify:CR=1 FL=1
MSASVVVLDGSGFVGFLKSLDVVVDSPEATDAGDVVEVVVVGSVTIPSFSFTVEVTVGPCVEFSVCSLVPGRWVVVVLVPIKIRQ